MNAHFEIDNNSYPISPMYVGEGYRITDMRDLSALDSTLLALAQAYSIAATLNNKIRSGELPREVGSTQLRDAARELVSLQPSYPG